MFYKKEFGQNFLKNRSDAKKLIQAASVTKDDTVVEVGAGAGMVTQYLCEEAGKLIAIEIDKRFIKMLSSRFLEDSHVRIVKKDILQFDPNEYNLASGSYKVVGSLPYNISKKIIQLFLENSIYPSCMSVIIQKEVAEDYSKTVPHASFLSNYGKIFSDISLEEVIPKEHFRPEPKVDGAIITFKNIMPRYENPRKLAKFIKSSFLNPRKMLINNLSGIYKMSKTKLQEIFKKEHIDCKFRAGNLSLDQWYILFNIIAK